MKRLSTRLVASAMALTMLFGALAACSKTTPAPEASKTEPTQEEPKKDEPKVGGKVVVGATSEPSGDFATPYWQNNATDKDVNQLMAGYATFYLTPDGEVKLNEEVVEKFETKENEDKTKTYTFTLKGGNVFSDGTPIKAEHYAANILFFSSSILKELGAKTSLSNGVKMVGFEEFNEGTSKEFKGVRVLSDKEFSFTIKSKYLPNFFEMFPVSSEPFPYYAWTTTAKTPVELKDDGNGAYFTEGFVAADLKDEINKARNNPTLPRSGPYVAESFDEANKIVTLKLNPKYTGTYMGKKATIETIVYKKVIEATALDELRTGAIDILSGSMSGDQINAGLTLVEKGDGNLKFDYTDYPRAGFGRLMFVCDFGPTQFPAVRKAIAHLINRDDFVKQFTGGFGTVVNGPYGEGQWFYKKSEKDLKAKLNSYPYSLEQAVKLLEEDGWTLDASGNPYNGTGLRHKKVGEELMPLLLRWSSSEKNPVSELLVTLLQKNPDTEKAGMKIEQDTMPFTELLSFMYRDGSENPKYAEKTYHMFNLGSGFPVGYVPEFAYTTDPKMLEEGQNTNFIIDEELDRLANAYWRRPADQEEEFVKGWQEFIGRWNELMPDIPLYSNKIHDFFNAKVKGLERTSNIDLSTSLLMAYVEE